MADLFKEVLPSITQTGENLLKHDGTFPDYVPFVVNRALSRYRDCVEYAQDMNLYPNIPKEYQYKYLLYTINKYKRHYVPWFKSKIDNRLQYIQQYFDCSLKKAKDYLRLLDEEDINEIVEKFDRGGIEK